MKKNREEDAALQKAAARSLLSIQKNRCAALRQDESQVCALLEHIEVNLFDPRLGVGQAARACDIRDRSVGCKFKAFLGKEARAYITEHRVEVAEALLLQSRIPIGRIGKLVGFSSAPVFTKAFQQAHGVSPSVYRAAGQVQAESPEKGLALREMRTAVLGAVDQREAERLQEQLDCRYPWWKAVCRDAALRPQQQSVGEQPLFAALLKRSREEGRGERQQRRRGVELAQQALEALRLYEGVGGEALPEQEALGWAYLGNAQRLANQSEEAEQAFATAWKAWQGAPGPRDPMIEAELCLAEAGLHTVHRGYEKALPLVQRAVELAREHGARRSRVLVEALILRSTIWKASCIQKCIEDRQEALVLLRGQEQDQPYLLATAHGSLATAYAVAGEFDAANEHLPKAQVLCEAFGYRLALSQLLWTEGLVKRSQGELDAAEKLLLSVLQGIDSLEEMGYAAVARVDLAIVYWLQGRTASVLEVLGEAMPIFGALRLESDALAAVAVALEARKVPLILLRQARIFLGQHYRLPEIRDDES